MELSFDRLLGIFGVLGIFIGIGVAVAMDPKAKSELIVAVCCFVFSGISLCATVGIWAFGTESFLKRLLVTCPFFLLIGVATVEASRWAYGRYVRGESTEKPPSEHSLANPSNGSADSKSGATGAAVAKPPVATKPTDKKAHDFLG